ncbi:MAG TPA: OmpA family protein [Candidatus Aminicenantes bacterium]|nr:OmpA family protein [Candidatus Aminicenantes bacterium]HRY65386.1 OmpA family protein [Candidatus Aminicenantes bacterium]HRZ72146.1 OmpA family protein [Candidatus Aminicenantes bacterium]
MKRTVWSAILAALVLLPLALAAQETDAEGCQDHPLLGRMKGFVLTECESNFDAVEFCVAEDTYEKLEGQKTLLYYNLMEGFKEPSELQIVRNYTNAVKAAGGTVVYEYSGYAAMKIIKGAGQAVWVRVEVYNNGTAYQLTILEIGEMAQEVTAGDMLAALNKDGRIALEIHFDTGRASIKPESQKTVGEIAALLRDNPGLLVSIEGHTDNTGTPQGNRTLSEERAKAVVAAVAALGIEASRLSAVGWGQDKPVADNATEEGRARNRRVEVVKK